MEVFHPPLNLKWLKVTILHIDKGPGECTRIGFIAEITTFCTDYIYICKQCNSQKLSPPFLCNLSQLQENWYNLKLTVLKILVVT